MTSLRAVLLAGVFLIAPATEAFAQQLDAGPPGARRPGSTGGGGRVGAVCNNDLLSREDQVTCKKLLETAKTPEERTQVRNLIDARIREMQDKIEEYSDRSGRNAGGKPR